MEDVESCSPNWMEDVESCSPNWKRPLHVLKVKKRRKTSLSSDNSALKRASSKLSNLSAQEARLLSKRKNPFSCSPRKKKHINRNRTFEDKQHSDQEDNSLFKRLNQVDTENVVHERCLSTNEEASRDLIKANNELEPSEQRVRSLTEQKNAEIEQSQQTFEHFPVDWSIKTRIRFTSLEPFNWCASLKSSDEAAGLSAFVKCVHESVACGVKGLGVSNQLKSKFHQHTLVWMHPAIPWFTTFPRILPEPKLSKPSFAVSSDVIQSSLFASWCESFRSIFHLLRSQHCPYFYLCIHQFTVLFQAAGIGGSKHILALITPTTKGFRDALEREGIEFTLPLLQPDEDGKRLSEQSDPSFSKQTMPVDVHESIPSNTSAPDEDDYEDDISHDDEAPSSWIQSIGLDKKEFPSLDPHKVKLQRDKVIKLDHRPQSLVLVEGTETQALFNFLLNSSTTVAVAGFQAGIPPSIVAPVAFEGATLQTCKVKISLIKQENKSGSLDTTNNLEIAGVILPNSVQGLCEILKTTQSGNFTAIFNTHEPTVAFNRKCSKNDDQDHGTGQGTGHGTGQGQLIQCGLSDHVTSGLRAGNTLQNGFLREIRCETGKYTWSL